MSQQEFMPQSQGANAQDQDHDTISTQSPIRSAKSRARAMPKSEHPSAYSESPPPYSYHAQDDFSKQSDNKTTASQSRRKMPGQHFSPDGDAFETHYRPYTQYRAQPQTPRRLRLHRYIRRIIKVIVVLAVIAFLLKVVLLLLSLVAIAILLLVFIAFALIAAYIAFRVLIFLGVPFGRRRQYGSGSMFRWR